MAMLPCSIAIMVLLYLAAGAITTPSLTALLLALLTTLALRWMSNALQLIRVRSWAISSVFALLVGTAAPLHDWAPEAMGLALLYLVHIAGLLFSTEGARPQVGVLISSVALALMSMIEPLMLWLLLPMLVAMLFALRVLTGRTLTALFFGLLLPYEVWLAVFLYANGAEALAGLLQEDTLRAILAPASGQAWAFDSLSFAPEALLPHLPRLGVGVLLLFSLIANIHFMRTSIDDKISVRMHYVTLLLQWPVLVALPVTGCLQAEADISRALLPVVCVAVCSAPLLGRYIVFARGRGAAVVSWLMMLTLLFLWLCPYLFSA